MLRRALPLLAALLIGGVAARAEPLKLRVGWAPAPSQLTALSDDLMKRHPALFPHLAKSYVLEPLRFRQRAADRGAGERRPRDRGARALELALAIGNAHLDLRIVADVMQDGVPGHFDTYWAVRKDGPVRTIKDMRHRHAAINAFGATTDMVLRGTLRQHGVADNEYVVIEANFANMLAMMENDKIDLVPVMPQFNHDFAATGRYRTLFTVGQARGPVSQAVGDRGPLHRGAPAPTRQFPRGRHALGALVPRSPRTARRRSPSPRP